MIAMIILSNLDFYFMISIILCLIGIIFFQAKEITRISDTLNENIISTNSNFDTLFSEIYEDVEVIDNDGNKIDDEGDI